MKPFTISQLLWFAAGADPSIMEKCPPRERMRYAVFGTAVFIPTCLALFGSANALTYLTTTWQAIAIFSISWSFIVFTLDRTLMLDDSAWNIGFLLRIGLAICVSFALSLPIELKVFEESLTKAIRLEQDSTANVLRYQLEFKIESIESQIKDLNKEWVTQRDEYLKEVDGTGGSLVKGESNIALIKKRLYKEDSTRIAAVIQDLKNQIAGFRKKSTDKALQDYVEDVCADDLLARIATLNQLAEKNKSVDWTIWLLRWLLIFLEIIPVAVKLSLGKKGVYFSLQESLNTTIIEVNSQIQSEGIEMSVLFERLENLNKRLKLRLDHARERANSIFDRLKIQQTEILRGIEEKKNFEAELLQTELDDVTRIVVEQTKERIFQEYFDGVASLFDEMNN